MQSIQTKNVTDSIIWVLTVALLTSFSINNLNVNGSFILIIITIIVLMSYVIQNHGLLYYHIGKFQIMILIFGLFSLMSSIWSINASYAIEKGVTIIEILICVSIFFWVYSARNDPVRDLLKAVMWSGYCIVIYTFIFYGTDVIMDALNNSQRLNSAFDNVNRIGLICAMTIIIALYFAIKEKPSLSNFLCIPTLLLLLACGSRKSLIILGVGLFLVLLLKALGEKRAIAIFKLIVVLFFAILVIRAIISLPVFGGINQRMEGLLALITGEGKVDHSAWVREQYIQLGIRVFKEHPILGVGMGNVRILNEQALGDNCYLHNNFAELLANGGIVGFGLFYWLYLDVIVGMKKNNLLLSYYGQIIITLIVCILLADYGSVSYYSKDTYFYFLIFYIFIEQYDDAIGFNQEEEIE